MHASESRSRERTRYARPKMVRRLNLRRTRRRAGFPRTDNHVPLTLSAVPNEASLSPCPPATTPHLSAPLETAPTLRSRYPQGVYCMVWGRRKVAWGGLNISLFTERTDCQ